MELERLNQNMTLKDANPGNALRVVGLFFQLPFVFLLDGLL